MNIENFYLEKFNLNSKFCLYCSTYERNIIVRHISDLYKKKYFDVFNYNILKIGNNYNIDNEIMYKKNSVLFAKIIRPIDYLLLRRFLDKHLNIFTFICGNSYYSFVDKYNYIIFEKNYILNKIKILKLLKTIFKYNLDKSNFDNWWNNLSKKWIIIRTSDFKYFNTDNLIKYFNEDDNIFNIENKLSYLDFIYDYY